MARKTLAQLTAENEALRAGLQGAQAQLDSLQLRIKHDYIERAEYNRVQALLRTTQQFMAKYKRQARPSRAASPSKEDLAAYFAAHPGARSVSSDDLAAFLAR